MPDIVRILQTFEIIASEVSEYHPDACPVVTVQDDFFILSDCFHIIKTCFCVVIADWAEVSLLSFFVRHPAH